MKRKELGKKKSHKWQDFEESTCFLFHFGDFRISHQIETPFSKQ
jgi:hypothetical protein